MKKFLLTLGAMSVVLTGFAGKRILYQQNFENATSAKEAGWSDYGGEALNIASDSEGKYLEIKQGQNNGRSTQLAWGQGIFLNSEGESIVTEDYTVSYDFCIKQGSNNQYNSEFTVYTNHAPIVNNKYFLPWSQKAGARIWENWLFDMNQNEADNSPTQFYVDSSATPIDNEGDITYAMDTNTGSLINFDENVWYRVTLVANVNSREVETTIESLAGETVYSETRKVPENNVNGDPISMYAEGLFILVARYQTIYYIDNINVYVEVDGDYANPPTVALTRIGQTADEELNLNMRAYTISFYDEETLNVTGTDGQTQVVEYADCDGAFVYETTKSGTLTAWTTSGTAESAKVTTEVNCDPIVLPAATATLSSVSAGYGKTYTLKVDNSEVPLRPLIFMDYEFVGISGEKISGEGVTSGAQVSVEEEGTLTITTLAYGYESCSVDVVNNLQFETKQVWDFARMTEDEIKAAGFPAFETLNSSKTSGFDNWTARKRLYYQLAGSEHENDEGAIVYDNIYPFGFISEDEEKAVIKYTVIDRSAIPTTTSGEYFPGLTIFPDRGKVDEGGLPNVGMIYRVGLYNDQTKNNNNNVVVDNLDPTDFVVVNFINAYGQNSNHPICATDQEYYDQLAGEDTVIPATEIMETVGEGDDQTQVGTGKYNAVYPLYRIDTVITKLTVFKQLGDAVETIGSEVIGDGYYYTIDGLRLAEPNQPGLYIRNGKKIIVK